MVNENINGWKLEKGRNPYRGFRYQKGDYVIGSQKVHGKYNFFLQEMKTGNYLTSIVRTNRNIRLKDDAIVFAIGLMGKVDRGEIAIKNDR